jgi:hypothetical protein
VSDRLEVPHKLDNDQYVKVLMHMSCGAEAAFFFALQMVRKPTWSVLKTFTADINKLRVEDVIICRITNELGLIVRSPDPRGGSKVLE